MTMDKPTLKALLDEARKHYRRASSRFSKHDNCDDMHDMDMWRSTAQWINGKLKGDG